MLDEILEMDEGEEGTNIEVDERNVQTFNVDEYGAYIEEVEDEELRAQLIEMLRDRRPGWQSRARWLVRARKGYESYQRNMDALIQKVTTPPRPRGGARPHPKLRNMPARDSMRVSLRRMTEAQLKETCEAQNVSYESFMRTGDRGELIEAILDEMWPRR